MLPTPSDLPLQVSLLATGAAFVVVLLVGDRHVRPGVRVLALALMALCGAGLIVRATRVVRQSQSARQLAGSIPHVGMADGGFVSSNTCRSCHPSQYESWHRSFHRTMTQAATPAAVIAPFEGVTLESRGREYRLQRRGDEFWVHMVDPDWDQEQLANKIDPDTLADRPLAWKRVVMTTGSHHQQTYWVASRDGRRLHNLPFTYLRQDRRWVPREDVFLRPPTFGRMFSRWNDNCIECHSVAGELKIDSQTGVMATEVAELGISCEACHGPAREHVLANRDPQRRYRYHLGFDAEHPPPGQAAAVETSAAGISDAVLTANHSGSRASDPTIVRPDQLAAARSAQVCGQCHGMNILKTDRYQAGQRYRAGGDLTEVKMVLNASEGSAILGSDRADWPRLVAHIARQQPTYLDERFWPDGMVRVSGREHNAMIESACFRGGTLSCLSCHRIHESDPDDQLARGMDGNAACLQCHGELAADITAHTHHRPGSPGSECYNCHMPHTTYGLLKGIRSHLIDSPTVAGTVQTGRPNACNLCHLDQTLAWTASQLARWYGQPAGPSALELSEDDRTIAAAVLLAMRGDAAQRALIADRMGWAAAQEASGRSWLAPYLGQLLNDPYSAVRYIAHRSLRTLPGYDGFEYDFVGPAEDRVRAGQRVQRLWREHDAATVDRTGPAVLINSDHSLRLEVLKRLARQRDDRPVDLRE